MLTPLDQIANQNHLQLIKAMLPYIPTQKQKSFSVIIKLMEMQNIIHFYNQHQNFLHCCSTSEQPSGILDLLTELRNYCTDTEQALFDQWIQLFSTMELYSMFLQTPEDLSAFMQQNASPISS